MQVCMLTCFPKLLYNFIYRDLTLKNVVDDPAEAARWFAARDLIIAATFCRHFWWHTLMLCATCRAALCRVDCTCTCTLHVL